MRVTTSKSKNSESFYITQSYTNAQGKSTSKTIRKLGTLAELSKRLHTDRDGVLAWANEQARLETARYKSEKEDALVMVPFHSNKPWTIISRNFSPAAIFSSSPFTMASRWIPYAGRSKAAISSNMI